MKIKSFTIPNCITLCNLLCGIGSIISSLVLNDLQVAFAFVLASAVFDFFDGFSARLLNQYSAVGVQLDSLADIVSFGVAPAVGMAVLCGAMPSAFELNDTWCEVLCYVPLIVAAFSALRLAKFNIDETQKEEFEGLATPPSAILLLSLGALCDRYSLVVELEWLVLISVLVAILLVSPVRMFSFKFKSWRWDDNKLRYIFLLVSVVAILSLRLYAIPFVIVMYIVLSAVRWIAKR